jgi:hypothetical protein
LDHIPIRSSHLRVNSTWGDYSSGDGGRAACPQARRRDHKSLSCSARCPIRHVLYVVTFLVGSFIYTQYRVAIRIPLELDHYYKTVGFFDFKEHVATIGLMLLPAYWYFWKNPQNP